MRFPIFAALMLILASTRVEGMIQAAHPTSDVARPVTTTLAALRDHYRPLLVFAPSSKDVRLTRQARLFVGTSSGLRDRQVLIFTIIGKTEDHLKSDLQVVDQTVLSTKDADQARQKFHVAPEDFAVILIGKDGGEKFHTHTPVTMERLNAVIDAMPMRQHEVRNGNSK